MGDFVLFNLIIKNIYQKAFKMKIKKNKKGGDELKKVTETTNQKKSAVSKKDSDLQSKNLDDFLQDWSGNEENNSEAAEEEQSENSDEDSGSDDEAVSSSKQKQYLASLKAKDPEFHKFLEENDQELLNFDESSDDEDGAENDGLDPVHKLPDNLEVASDDSDYDDDDTDQKEGESKADPA